MARVLSFLIRYFSNYYTLHRSDLAARAASLDPLLITLIFCTKGTCGSINITITITTPPPIIVPSCGFLQYTIPKNTFTDMVGGNTLTYFLNFLTANNEIVPLNSWLRSNDARQIVYGIPIITQMAQSYSYNIRATHPLSGYKATTTLTFDNPSYQQLKPVAQSLCLITVEMTSSYNPDYDDVNLVFKFMLSLANYLKIKISDLKIHSFMRWNTASYPYKFSVTWTNCALTTTFIQKPYSEAYYTAFTSILQQLVTTSTSSSSSASTTTTMNQKIVSYFKSNTLYTITNIRTSNCTRPPKTPPNATRPWSVDLTCGFTQTLVPEDIFSDEQDGNTRQLTLRLLMSNGSSVSLDSWIFIDDSQHLDAMLSNAVVLQATNAKYEFLIKATDSDGRSATTPLTVNVPSKAFVKSSVRLQFLLNPLMNFPRSVILQAVLTDAIERVLAQAGAKGIN